MIFFSAAYIRKKSISRTKRLRHSTSKAKAKDFYRFFSASIMQMKQFKEMYSYSSTSIGSWWNTCRYKSCERKP
jgi:hypothetical protein